MSEPLIAWSTEDLRGGVLRVSFRGRGGIGSDGNPDGKRMEEAIREALADGGAPGLIVDLTDFEYRFGDWIAAVPLVALRALGTGRVCMLASGETAAALRSLWETCHLDQLIPLFGEPWESLDYLAGPEMGPDRVRSA